jgi:hypothetical protein
MKLTTLPEKGGPRRFAAAGALVSKLTLRISKTDFKDAHNQAVGVGVSSQPAD